MEELEYIIPRKLEPYINCIMIKSNVDPDEVTNIPLYADGYPGIMFQQSDSGFYLLPRNKKLSELFLFGQTVQPMSLSTKGTFSFIVIQLYPFASKYLLDIDPKELNNDCFDLFKLTHLDVIVFREKLEKEKNIKKQVDILLGLIVALIETNKMRDDDRIKNAISVILKNKGKVQIKSVVDRLNLTERTFERNFIAQVGLSPKQFAKIVQFQTSLHQLTKSNFNKLVEISYDSGFADQSHFIRAFKKYTGQTPSFYLKQLSIN